jgi:hypothetical protein
LLQKGCRKTAFLHLALLLALLKAQLAPQFGGFEATDLLFRLRQHGGNRRRSSVFV